MKGSISVIFWKRYQIFKDEKSEKFRFFYSRCIAKIIPVDDKSHLFEKFFIHFNLEK